MDRATNSFSIAACADYVENNVIATIEIDSLKQYNFESATDSVIIQIDSQQEKPIA